MIVDWSNVVEFGESVENGLNLVCEGIPFSDLFRMWNEFGVLIMALVSDCLKVTVNAICHAIAIKVFELFTFVEPIGNISFPIGCQCAFDSVEYMVSEK